MRPIRYILNAATLFTLTTAMGEITQQPAEVPSPFSLFSFEDEILEDDDLDNPLASLEQEEISTTEEMQSTISEQTAEAIPAEEAFKEEVAAHIENNTVVIEAATQDTVAVAPKLEPESTDFVSMPNEEYLFDEPESTDFFAESPVIEEPALTPIDPIALENEFQSDNLDFPDDQAVVETATVDSSKEEMLASPTEERVAFEKEIEADEKAAELDTGKAIALSTKQLPKEFASEEKPLQINLSQVFAGSPLIYSILLIMSMGAVFIWLYNVLSLRYADLMPDTLLKPLRNKLNANQYDEALSLCAENNNFFTKMVASGIRTRKNGTHVMIEAMKAEGKRATGSFWTRMALLNDIAIIAPMLGLLGTVLGMFYAFYDLNRTTESVTTLFDGLGISVGTTVAGLVVAILAMILHSTAKYRLVRMLARVENEAYSLADIIESKTPNQGG